MTDHIAYGYAGKFLRVNLTDEQVVEETIEEAVLRQYLGGAGIGAYYLYKEVTPGVEWSDPENRLIIATGPINGTVMGGSGGFIVASKGSLTNGAAIAQANGSLGAYLKFCGYDGIIIQGAAKTPSYLYIYDSGVEIKDAAHLEGKVTWEVEDLIKRELGKSGRKASVFSIGPAGENLVRFACIVGDRGHVAAHNGVGAVMGSKNLKAIVVERGKGRVLLSDRKKFSQLAKALFEKATKLDPSSHYKWGTLGTNSKADGRVSRGYLPVKNYTTNIPSGSSKISAEDLRSQPQFEFTRYPCWACRFNHCQLVKITEGPFAGYEVEAPDYESAAGFGPLIGNTNWEDIVILSNEVDGLGMDANESAWLVAWLMECFEKGLIRKETTDGLEMKWGDVKTVRTLLHKIANREGFGDALADGVMRVARHLGGDLEKLAVYTIKGNTPRMHDHRSSWTMLLDTVTSDRGRDMDAALIFGLFEPKAVAESLAKIRGRGSFSDSLMVCKFNIIGSVKGDLVELVAAATGWDFSDAEARQIELRITNLLRAFNIRHGFTRDLDAPSPKYSSTPTDGPAQGKGIAPVWDIILDNYYKLMGWDNKTGKPLPSTLRNLGLDYAIADLWEKKQ